MMFLEKIYIALKRSYIILYNLRHNIVEERVQVDEEVCTVED